MTKLLTQAQAQRIVDEMNYKLAWGKNCADLSYKLIDCGWDTKEVNTDDPDFPNGYRFEIDLEAEFEDEPETDDEDEEED